VNLKGAPVIVTGAAQGLGEATARHLKNMGAKVALFDLNAERLKPLADEIDALAVRCDVADERSATEAVTTARRAHGTARVLVNCAAVTSSGPLIRADGTPLSLAEIAQEINVHLIGTLNLVRLFAADLAQADAFSSGERGVIINVASGAAFDPPTGSAAYTAAKGGVVSVGLALAREFGDLGIRVNTISPGAMLTPLLMSIQGTPLFDSIASMTPFPKRIGRPEEFAKLVSHVCENEYLNASVIRIDGANRIPYHSDGVPAASPSSAQTP
jgi:NAD(P)-dependent dehydrogenase (short-subunit alcohol dehydrogenase family)